MNKMIKETIITVLIIIIVILIRMFIVTPALVKGYSMLPTLDDKNLLLINKFDKNLERFDIVILKNRDSLLVKRIIGLPGENIEYKDSKLLVNGIEIAEEFEYSETRDFDINVLEVESIPRDFYFVMGDNRDNSQDSRTIGLIYRGDIVGKTNFRLYPLNKFGKIE